MCWHKWNKWIIFDNVTTSTYDYLNNGGIPMYRTKIIFQERKCAKCGLTQVKKQSIKF